MRFKIDGKHIIADTSNFTSNYTDITFYFDFSPDWITLTKTCWIYKSITDYEDIEIIDNKCTIPPRILANSNTICIGITGKKNKKNVISTVIYPLLVIDGAIKADAVLPTVDEYKKILSYFALISVGMHGENLQIKNITADTDQKKITPDPGYTGLSCLNIFPTPSNTLIHTITSNGSIILVPPTGSFYDKAQLTVAVPAAIVQSKICTAGTSSFDITPDVGYGGLSKLTVIPTPTEDKTQNIIANGTYTIMPSTGKHISKFIATVNIAPTPSESAAATYTANGTYTIMPSNGKLLSLVTVNVNINGSSIKLQEKTVTPSEILQAVSPDIGYNGLSKVIIDATPTVNKIVAPSTSEQKVEPDPNKFLSSVTVLPVPSQTKTINATGEQQIVTPDTGCFLNKVIINAIKEPSSSFYAPVKQHDTSSLIVGLDVDGYYTTKMNIKIRNTDIVSELGIKSSDITNGHTVLGINGTGGGIVNFSITVGLGATNYIVAPSSAASGNTVFIIVLPGNSISPGMCRINDAAICSVQRANDNANGGVFSFTMPNANVTITIRA